MRRLLNEDENDSPVSGMLKSVEEPPDSVDDIIDSLIIRYESEAVKEDDDSEKMLESLDANPFGSYLSKREMMLQLMLHRLRVVRHLKKILVPRPTSSHPLTSIFSQRRLHDLS